MASRSEDEGDFPTGPMFVPRTALAWAAPDGATSDSSAEQPPPPHELRSRGTPTDTNGGSEGDSPVRGPAVSASIGEGSDNHDAETGEVTLSPATLAAALLSAPEVVPLQPSAAVAAWAASTVTPPPEPPSSAPPPEPPVPDPVAVLSVHLPWLGQALYWVPYPTEEDVSAFHWEDVAPTDAGAWVPWHLRRLSFGNLWSVRPALEIVNFLIHTFGSGPTTDGFKGPRVSLWEDSTLWVTTNTDECIPIMGRRGLATVAFEAPAAAQRVIAAMNRCVLFDLTGLWYAVTREQKEFLRAYALNVSQMEYNARRAFLRTLPDMPLFVELAPRPRREQAPSAASTPVVAAPPAALLPPASRTRSVHSAVQGDGLRWVPYATAEQVRHHRWGELANADTFGGRFQRLYFGNVWGGCLEPHALNFLIDTFVNRPVTGALRGPRVTHCEQHTTTATAASGERYMFPAERVHATIACDSAVSARAVIDALHQRVLFDLTGLWYADTPAQIGQLLVYTRRVWQMEQRARHAFLRTLPCTPLTVGFSREPRRE